MGRHRVAEGDQQWEEGLEMRPVKRSKQRREQLGGLDAGANGKPLRSDQSNKIRGMRGTVGCNGREEDGGHRAARIEGVAAQEERGRTKGVRRDGEESEHGGEERMVCRQSREHKVLLDESAELSMCSR